MTTSQTFAAPRSKTVTLLTIITLIVLFTVSTVAPFALFNTVAMPMLVGIIALPWILVLLCLAYAIKHYELSGDELIIHRIIAKPKRFSLTELKSASPASSVSDGSFRLFGNGGLFTFSGLFWNKKAGKFSAYMNSEKEPLLLEFASEKIMITPSELEAFLKLIARFVKKN